MIKFFRHIRQSLIMNNQTGRYLKYAIGEILLVVIGILIALQINNWNEQSHQLKEETKLLIALEKEISTNLENVDAMLKSNQEILESSQSLLEKGLKNANYQISNENLLDALSYNYNKIETSITDEILGTDSRALISNDSVLTQLRRLKLMYEKANKTLFYVDEFWNVQVTSFFNKSGLGIYWATDIDHINEEFIPKIKPNKELFSLLGIMNGYQKTLLYSRNELNGILNETLSLVRRNISYND